MFNKIILITGAKGFIGSNLIKALKVFDNITIIELNRDTPLSILEENIQSIDFIFHFAGEVRPKSSDDEFEKSNAVLTKLIIDIIEKNNVAIPFLMTSSIHAELQKNAYGKTKRDAEISLEQYSDQNNSAVWIYRLPHVFGESCKANYNSVISTWMFNSIHDKEIVVFDRSIPMTYVYVQDLVAEFVELLKLDKTNDKRCTYIKPKITYNTSLGETVDYIDEFKELKDQTNSTFVGFKRKLYLTYQDYKKNS